MLVGGNCDRLGRHEDVDVQRQKPLLARKLDLSYLGLCNGDKVLPSERPLLPDTTNLGFRHLNLHKVESQE